MDTEKISAAGDTTGTAHSRNAQSAAETMKDRVMFILFSRVQLVHRERQSDQGNYGTPIVMTDSPETLCSWFGVERRPSTFPSSMVDLPKLLQVPACGWADTGRAAPFPLDDRPGSTARVDTIRQQS